MSPVDDYCATGGNAPMESDQRDRWSKGLIRHLRVDENCPPDEAFALRLQRDGGMLDGGSDEIFYTLVIAPKHAKRADKVRRQVEGHPGIGGVFSPPRDLS